MATIDFGKLAGDMGSAFLKSLGKDYPNIREYSKAEFQHLAAWLQMIVKETAAGKMTQEQAELLYEMQRLAMRNVFLTVEGLGLLAVEAAINAAIEVARVAINTALKFTLL